MTFMTQLQPHQGYPDLKLQILGQNGQKEIFGHFRVFFFEYSVYLSTNYAYYLYIYLILPNTSIFPRFPPFMPQKTEKMSFLAFLA